MTPLTFSVSHGGSHTPSPLYCLLYALTTKLLAITNSGVSNQTHPPYAVIHINLAPLPMSTLGWCHQPHQPGTTNHMHINMVSLPKICIRLVLKPKPMSVCYPYPYPHYFDATIHFLVPLFILWYYYSFSDATVNSVSLPEPAREGEVTALNDVCRPLKVDATGTSTAPQPPAPFLSHTHTHTRLLNMYTPQTLSAHMLNICSFNSPYTHIHITHTQSRKTYHDTIYKQRRTLSVI